MNNFVTENQTKNLTDEKLFELCKHFGRNALLWRQKFAGLLPEVNKRQLYAQKGFDSIFVFAFKLAGLSEKQVRIVLNLERRFEDKPILQTMLVKGEVSVNKLARVVSIATPENQEALAEQVKILPKSALETLARDIKNSTMDGLGEPTQSLPGQTSFVNRSESATAPGELLSMKVGLKLDDDIIKELHELQEKGININEIIHEALKKRRSEIAQQKEELAAEVNGKAATMGGADGDAAADGPIKKLSSRYISVKVKRLLAQEYGTKCAVPSCARRSEVKHHSARFALTGVHDPRFMAPLCRNHHLIAHSVDAQFWRKRRTTA